MRLIDADELEKKKYSYFSHETAKYRQVVFMGDVDHMPTIDAVPVVRCKDCIHWYDREGVCLKIYSDGAVSPYAWQDRKPDDFCSYGEQRKEAEGDV